MSEIDQRQIDIIAHIMLFTNGNGDFVEKVPGVKLGDGLPTTRALCKADTGIYVYYFREDGAACYFQLMPWVSRQRELERIAIQGGILNTRDEGLLMYNQPVLGPREILRDVVYYSYELRYDYILPQDLHFALQKRMRVLVTEHCPDSNSYSAAEIVRNRGGFTLQLSDDRYTEKLMECDPNVR